MKKDFKEFKIKKPKAFKENRAEKKTRKYKYAKNVKSDDLMTESHVVIDESNIRDKLMIMVAILLFLSSVFMVIYQIIRVNNMNVSIEKTMTNIVNLENVVENIDEHNEIYAHKKLKDVYNKGGSLFYELKTLWNYGVYVNDIRVTPENFNTVSKGIKTGEEVTVELRETLSATSLPYLIAYEGSALQGEMGDTLDTFFLNFNTSLNVNKKVSLYNIEEGYNEELEKTVITAQHYVRYQYTKGENDATFGISYILADWLDFTANLEHATSPYYLLVI